jgi:thiamine-phosphate pyrophosphorylase
MARPATTDPLRAYAITDRSALRDESLTDYVRRAVAAGVDMVQVREKDLTDRALYALVCQAVDITRGSVTRILVNDRLDIARAAGADGVQLGGHSVDASTVRRFASPEFLIGVSTHSLPEARAARDAGADFITFGPVWFTPSKAQYGPPLGLSPLTAVLEEVDLPVYPLGGIDSDRLTELYPLPIAGIAAISLFQNAADLATMVQIIRNREIQTA